MERATDDPTVVPLSAMAYRLLRDVRTAGQLQWREVETRIADPQTLEAAVDWLADRDLVLVDGHGIRTA